MIAADSLKLWEVVQDAALSHFVHEEINLVEEENHGDLFKDPVVDEIGRAHV